MVSTTRRRHDGRAMWRGGHGPSEICSSLNCSAALSLDWSPAPMKRSCTKSTPTGGQGEGRESEDEWARSEEREAMSDGGRRRVEG